MDLPRTHPVFLDVPRDFPHATEFSWFQRVPITWCEVIRQTRLVEKEETHQQVSLILYIPQAVIYPSSTTATLVGTLDRISDSFLKFSARFFSVILL